MNKLKTYLLLGIVASVVAACSGQGGRIICASGCASTDITVADEEKMDDMTSVERQMKTGQFAPTNQQ